MPQCPFMHGTPLAQPYPGYIHGTNPAICPNGCIPVLALSESPLDTLRREAQEFISNFCFDMEKTHLEKSERLHEVRAAIDATGTYEHTHEELEFGARLAWRNAPRCVMRPVWDELKLVDARHVNTNEGMFNAIVHHLETAAGSESLVPLITAFKPETLNQKDGPRIWNSQLVRYAGHYQQDSSIVGDPSEANFTAILKSHFDWTPQKQSRFDVMPIVVQISPDEPPAMFHLPSSCIQEVNIEHPEFPWMAQLGLKWYAIPAVSNMKLDLGGLVYGCAPFNGWYMVTEIGTRNLADSNRYDMLPQIAHYLQLDSTREDSLWREQAICALNVAVMHSFNLSGFTLSDHFSAAQGFSDWYKSEMKHRGYCPGNWKWLVPPTGGSATPLYHLNKMTEFTLKPGYFYNPSSTVYEREAMDQGFIQSKAIQYLDAFCCYVNTTIRLRRWMRSKGFKGRAQPEHLIIYSSMNGKTRDCAFRIQQMLKLVSLGCKIQEIPQHAFGLKTLVPRIQVADLVTIILPSYGEGELPRNAKAFAKWLDNANNASCFKFKNIAVVGRGDRSYTHFAGASDIMLRALTCAGACSFMPLYKIDVLQCEKTQEKQWIDALCAALDWSPHAALHANNGEDTTCTITPLSKWALAAYGSQRKPHGEAEVCDTKFLVFQDDYVVRKVTLCLDLMRKYGNRRANYNPGDWVKIFPHNDPKHVIRLMEQLGLAPEQVVEMSHESPTFPFVTTFQDIFESYVDLSQMPSDTLVAKILKLATNESHIAITEAFSQPCKEVFLSVSDLFAMLHRDPQNLMKVNIGELMTLFPLMQPRTYSICSSQTQEVGDVDLVVAMESYVNKWGKRILGQTSNALTSARIGTFLRIEITPNPAFWLATDPRTPMLLIGAGTGIAPFRSFVQQRVHESGQGHLLGQIVLVHGCRGPDSQLFQQEFSSALECGVLHQYAVAYSRHTSPKQHVNDVISSDGLAGAVQSLLGDGAHVYVCGMAAMVEGVGAALCSVMQDSNLVQGLSHAKRYHVECFGQKHVGAEFDCAETASCASTIRGRLREARQSQGVAIARRGSI